MVSSKSEVVCKIPIFKGLNSIATIQNFQLDISFDSRYEISIFRIRWKDTINYILMFLVSLKSGLFYTRYVQLKSEIELSNYRAIFNSIYNYLYSNDDVYNIYVRILFKINFSSILFKIIHFKYSKFAIIAKIKNLNWLAFPGYYTRSRK